MGYQLIEHIEVGSGGAASIEFTGIPQDGVDLVCSFSARNVNNGEGLQLALNASTAISRTQLTGDGSAVASFSSSTFFMFQSRSSFTANTFGNAMVHISNYTSATNKSISADCVSENNGTEARAQTVAGSYTTTSPITQFKLISEGGNFAEFSTASLYKITAD